MQAQFDIPEFAIPDPAGYKTLEDPVEVEWISPSNIALVKYWGKHGIQLPMNPSVSFTLTHCHTRTSVSLVPRTMDDPWLSFWMDGEEQKGFDERIHLFLQAMITVFPFLETAAIRINTSNTFPHSAGIASSASAMGALALCLVSLDERLRRGEPASDFFRKASFIARLGSGSAARSVYPLLASWGVHPAIPESSDLYALPVEKVNPIFHEFRDAILIVDDSRKSISSSDGHKLMQTHPFSVARKAQAMDNMLVMMKSLQSGDLEAFIQVAELEALTLHGLMMSSTPSYTLLKEETLSLIREIRAFREQSHIPLCFTLDAGPNIHLLYPGPASTEVEAWITQELLRYCKDGRVIFDEVGSGPISLK